MNKCKLKAFVVFLILTVVFFPASGQRYVSNLPMSASCFPSVTINRLTVIQTRIIAINNQFYNTKTPEISNQSLLELLNITAEANAIYENAILGIERTQQKEQAAAHKKISEEQLADATTLANALAPTNGDLTTSIDKTLYALAELDSAFSVVNPCPEKGKVEFYTDSNGHRQINLSMVNRFKLVWNEANAPLTYDNYTYQSRERDLFRSTDLSQLWSNYRFAQTEKSDTSVENGSTNNTATNATVASNQETDKGNYRLGSLHRDGTNETASGGNVKALISTNGASTLNKESKDPLNRQNRPSTVTGPEVSRANISESDKTIAAYTSGGLSADFFTVQIAANRTQLDTKLLKLLYNGSYAIEERVEEGWYRYVVGRFFDIGAAVLHLNTSSIRVGMVTAYKGDVRTIIKTKVHDTQPIATHEGLIAVYRVQIAAARKPIPAQLLYSIHPGIRPINVYSEDGWFRYSIGDYLLYSDAISVRDSCGVSGAFIMPYINGIRQPFEGRENIDREEAKRTTNPVFVVQLAATKRPISLKKLKIYRENGIPVTLRIEDGWYKYTSDVFFNKDLARKKAIEMKVSGAFVVTYINGQRVNP
ncbi:hypothetical protein [Williamwhitmania taraxaci]|uniref:Uncharacterized protein n=1 Tax=Williamwhitmania taraxaci TaxID=1640674 RepID=A0A1G6SBJ9_9BACT|nr:hypothetical protein [Williamwhitmania taraxaci]SDD14268.1 hypothetical protein SAMN05216323_10917 [Williamwhitmania taraxaci]